LLAYKHNERKIKNEIEKMETENIYDSIKSLLYPYLPKYLQEDSLFPKQIYMYLYEGNGIPGYVFNSMLQTAKVNSYKSGIISAHDSYHSIVGGIFGTKLETVNHDSLTDEDKDLLFFLEIIAEEGIADLIDKPILGQPGSPLYAEVQALKKDEEIYAASYINSIDSLLKTCYRNGKVPPFSFQGFSKNGGHIPGRFMATQIKNAGLLSLCIKDAGDPMAFFETYQNALKSGSTAPRFSTESIYFLQKLRAKW